MTTATVSDLRNDCSALLIRVSAGEEIVITQDGKPVARLVPENQDPPKKVNWAESPAVTRDRGGEVGSPGTELEFAL